MKTTDASKSVDPKNADKTDDCSAKVDDRKGEEEEETELANGNPLKRKIDSPEEISCASSPKQQKTDGADARNAVDEVVGKQHQLNGEASPKDAIGEGTSVISLGDSPIKSPIKSSDKLPVPSSAPIPASIVKVTKAGCNDTISLDELLGEAHDLRKSHLHDEEDEEGDEEEESLVDDDEEFEIHLVDGDGDGSIDVAALDDMLRKKDAEGDGGGEKKEKSSSAERKEDEGDEDELDESDLEALEREEAGSLDADEDDEESLDSDESEMDDEDIEASIAAARRAEKRPKEKKSLMVLDPETGDMVEVDVEDNDEDEEEDEEDEEEDDEEEDEDEEEGEESVEGDNGFADSPKDSFGEESKDSSSKKEDKANDDDDDDDVVFCGVTSLTSREPVRTPWSGPRNPWSQSSSASRFKQRGLPYPFNPVLQRGATQQQQQRGAIPKQPYIPSDRRLAQLFVEKQSEQFVKRFRQENSIFSNSRYVPVCYCACVYVCMCVFVRLIDWLVG